MNFKRTPGPTIFFGLGLLFIIFFASSCKHDGTPSDQLKQVSFKEVLPIFTTNCASCHGQKGEGFALTDYSSIVRSVQPGNSSKSKVYQALTSTFNLMPPNNPLTTSQRTLIRLWIDQGAKNN
jgi:uncharacterized membrane protein